MKAEELRLGNYVMAKSPEREKYEQPVTVNIGYLDMFIHNQCDMMPILLTEEWLSNTGFTRIHFTSAFKSPLYYKKLREDTSDMLTLRPYFKGGYLWGHSESEEDFPSEMGSPIAIEYVHHLQNLYYALTGEELIIKET
jgi:hypothetical protein